MEMIYNYSAKQAIDDGFYSEIEATGYYKYPVFFSEGLKTVVDKTVKIGADINGVKHDIFWMSRFGKKISESKKMFQVKIGRKNYNCFVTIQPLSMTEAKPVVLFCLVNED